MFVIWSFLNVGVANFFLWFKGGVRCLQFEGNTLVTGSWDTTLIVSDYFLLNIIFFFIAESPNFSDSFIEVDIFWKQIYLFWRFGIWRLLRRKLFLAIIGVACLVSRCTISICKYRSPATKTKWTHLPVLMKACLTDTILLTNYYLRWLFFAIYLGWTGLGRLIFATKSYPHLVFL